MFRKPIILIPSILILFLYSCSIGDFSDDREYKLAFSNDTISFDTVFTTLGTTTRRFQIKNKSPHSLEIDRIALARGNDSPFRLNVNGITGNEISELLIPAGDSVIIFVAVTIDPSDVNNPFEVKDSILFMTNGNLQNVKLIAFGQNFHLFKGETLKSQHWKNDKPYLIYNPVAVGKEEKLIIDAGCRIHFHRNSSLFVNGTLEVNGTFNNPVKFLSDRLEKEYENSPGQWGYIKEFDDGTFIEFGGIHFSTTSHDNKINCAIIKNANKGIQVDSLGGTSNPKLVISNTRVENMTLNCLYAQNTEIVGSNCIFANSGSFTVAILLGGSYELNHCTIANYFGLNTRKTGSLILKNYYDYGTTRYVYNQLKADFRNCIVYGSVENELDLINDNRGIFNYSFINCDLKTTTYFKPTDPLFSGSVFNKDPGFKLISEHDYSIDSLSPARNIAKPEIAKLYPSDIFNHSRLADEGPDIGAIEWIPKKNK
jgi:hypothetical protein